LLKINGSGKLYCNEIQHLCRALFDHPNVFKQAANQSSQALYLTCIDYSSLGILRASPSKTARALINRGNGYLVAAAASQEPGCYKTPT
jgi:hypothetical protein